jgi:hypothetical protein
MNSHRLAFSFVEVIVAILLTALAVGPVYYVINHSAAGTVMTKDEVMAYQAAADVLEYLRSIDYDAPFLQPGHYRPCQSLPVAGGEMALDSRFRRTVTIVETAPADAPYRYKIVVVRVSWQVPGATRTLELPGLKCTGGNR